MAQLSRDQSEAKKNTKTKPLEVWNGIAVSKPLYLSKPKKQTHHALYAPLIYLKMQNSRKFEKWSFWADPDKSKTNILVKTSIMWNVGLLLTF